MSVYMGDWGEYVILVPVKYVGYFTQDTFKENNIILYGEGRTIFDSMMGSVLDAILVVNEGEFTCEDLQWCITRLMGESKVKRLLFMDWETLRREYL